METAAKAVGYDFSAISKPANDKDTYALSYADFVVPLVKAVQEQQAQIDELRTELKIARNAQATPIGHAGLLGSASNERLGMLAALVGLAILGRRRGAKVV